MGRSTRSSSGGSRKNEVLSEADQKSLLEIAARYERKERLRPRRGASVADDVADGEDDDRGKLTSTKRAKVATKAKAAPSSSSSPSKFKVHREGSRKSGRVRRLEEEKREREEEEKREREEQRKQRQKEQEKKRKGGKGNASRNSKSNKRQKAEEEDDDGPLAQLDQDTLWGGLVSEEELLESLEAQNLKKEKKEEEGAQHQQNGFSIDEPTTTGKGEGDQGETHRQLLRRRWQFASMCHFCRLFGRDLKVSKFSSDQLENALVDPQQNTLFLSELVYRLCRENPYSTPPESKFYARESTMFLDKWPVELEKRLKTWWFKEYFHFTYTMNGLRIPLETKVEETVTAVEAEAEAEAEVPELGSELPQSEEALENGLNGTGDKEKEKEEPLGFRFMNGTPTDRLLVLHSLIEWRIEACPYVRDAVDRTVKDSDYGSPALREEPVATDRHGNRYYYLSQGGEDCRLYVEKPAVVTLRTCLKTNTQQLAKWCTPCTTLEEMQSFSANLQETMQERQEIQKKQKRAMSKQKGKTQAKAYWAKVEELEEEEEELGRVLKEEIIPQLEETVNARRRQEEKQKLYEMAVKKRSSRIASIHVQREEEERRRAEELQRREELAVQKALAKKEKEREKRMLERRRQMAEQMEEAHRRNLEMRIQSMIQRQSRYVNRLRASQTMTMDDPRNTKSWGETIWDMENGRVQFNPCKRRTKVEDICGPIDRNYVLLHEGNTHYGCVNGTNQMYMHTSPRERSMPHVQTSLAAHRLESMKRVAVSRQLQNIPSLKDDRVVKLGMRLLDFKKKEVIPEDANFLKVKIVCDFKRLNSFEEVYEKGAAGGLFRNGKPCMHKEDPLVEVLSKVKNVEKKDIEVNEEEQQVLQEQAANLPKIQFKFTGKSPDENNNQSSIMKVNGVH